MARQAGWDIQGRGLACLLAACLLTATAHAHAAESATTVPTLRLQARAQAGTLQWDGVIQPVRQSTVAAQVSGNIVALLVKAGDTVKAGQPLARIDERDTQAGLNRSQADVNQAEAQLANARMQWERSQALRAQGFISAAALDSAQAQWRSAQALVAAAQAGRSQAVLARGFATVTAPFDGRVLSTQAEQGDLASPGRPILTLYAPRSLRAVVQVPASAADQVKGAQTIDVQLPPGGMAEAARWVRPTHVVSLPGADPVSQTVEWRLDLPEVNALPGQTVRVRFSGIKSSGDPKDAANTVSAPASAILRRGELTAVYVVREGRFMLQAVRTGPAQGASPITIFSGVRAGDVIAMDAIKAGLANASPAQP
jgi:RND family efflux transporter MFP subunit